MRVIGGIARGHKLETIEGLTTRPTTDRIKETLFNIIAFDLPNCRFLDLFAGSGAIGIEALSRGAQEAVFVEEVSACVEMISKNLQHTKLIDKGSILHMDVRQAIDTLSASEEVFDIIFMDPPYKLDIVTEALFAIVSKGLLRKDGLVIVEHGADSDLPVIENLKIVKEKKYKTTIMTFLSLEEAVSC